MSKFFYLGGSYSRLETNDSVLHGCLTGLKSALGNFARWQHQMAANVRFNTQKSCNMT